MSALDGPPPGHPEHLPPVPGVPPLPPLRAAKGGAGAWCTLLGGASILFGVMLPWTVSSAVVKGAYDRSWSGFEHPDGGIYVLAGLIVAGWGVVRLVAAVPVGVQYLGVLPGFLIVVLGLDTYNAALLWSNTPQYGFRLWVGPGIGAIILGGAAVFVGALIASQEPATRPADHSDLRGTAFD
ncbi:hypothetical protein GCM10023321_84030 [Pseudonocardia eucalypti]|uniref:Uncharacterized protein n=1 Tax=Pseudonocardia eucalypti TaxID=648755 RepID=A0ABP9RFG2_9PSEU|nr:hypothetical protein [Pseudonocardia eucalypti]